MPEKQRLHNIGNFRLASQQIAGTHFNAAPEIVTWMGAMQAQDAMMAKWALGVRLPGATEQTVSAAIDRGEIIRTHVLRPTWHLVAASDIHWMLDLTAPHVKSAMRSRHKELGITDALLAKSYRIFEKALQGGKSLIREELAAELVKNEFPTDNSRTIHLLLCAELDGLLCSGQTRGNKHGYALLQERVPNARRLPREEAMVQLARRYFASHGPASLPDFIWWSGLPVKDARLALELVKNEFEAFSHNDTIYWHNPAVSGARTGKKACLLPAFDEYLISYKDRTAVLEQVHNPKAISENGIFRPVVVLNGQVAGLWKRTLKKNRLILETDLFQDVDKAQIAEAAEDYSRFMGLPVDIV